MLLRNGTGWKMVGCNFEFAGLLSVLDDVQDRPMYNSVYNYTLGLSLSPNQMTLYYVPKVNIAYIFPSYDDAINFDDNGNFIGTTDERYEIKNWKGLGVMSSLQDFRQDLAPKKLLIEKSYVVQDDDSPATKIAKIFLNSQSIEIKADARTVATFNSIDADIRNRKLSFNKLLQLINLMNGGYEVIMQINKKDLTADGGYKATPVASYSL